jgi:acyl carrier protein
LARIWTEILEKDYVGVDDNFFDLGGHSLLATQVLSRIRDRLDVEISLPFFFDKPTIAQLAQVISESKLKKT